MTEWLQCMEYRIFKSNIGESSSDGAEISLMMTQNLEDL